MTAVTRICLGWLAVSAVLLWVCWTLDPYVFALAALCGACLSACLVAWVAIRYRPSVLPALLASLPSFVAFLLLRSINWA